MRIASSCIVAFAIVIAMVPSASAQTAEAEMLFREGKRLFKKGQYAEACDKFEASDRLEPQINTELNLAICRQKNGQTSSAWAMFVKAGATAKHAGDKKRALDAQRRADAVEKQLVYLTIDVPAENAVDDLVIKRNDVTVDPGLLNQKVPVDPADYTITAEAPDHKSWSETISVKTKSKVVEVPRLERVERKVIPRKPDDGDHPTTTKPADTAPTPPPDRPAQPRKYTTAAIALVSVGAGAVALGTGFALYSHSLETQSDSVCPTTDCKDQHAVDLNRVARMDGWIANISWSIGGVALAGALAAWWLGSPDRDATVAPVVGRDHAGFVYGGRF